MIFVKKKQEKKKDRPEFEIFKNDKKRLVLSFFIPFVIIAVICVYMYVSLSVQKKKAEDEYHHYEQVLAETNAEINEARIAAGLVDPVYNKDKEYFDKVFGDIFTFYDLDSFRACRNIAKETYHLPDDFIRDFYSEQEFIENAYAESMLDIMLQYDSCELYYVRNDGQGNKSYIADITLGMVRYSDKVRIIMFFDVDKDNNILSVKYKIYG